MNIKESLVVNGCVTKYECVANGGNDQVCECGELWWSV